MPRTAGEGWPLRREVPARRGLAWPASVHCRAARAPCRAPTGAVSAALRTRRARWPTGSGHVLARRRRPVHRRKIRRQPPSSRTGARVRVRRPAAHWRPLPVGKGKTPGRRGTMAVREPPVPVPPLPWSGPRGPPRVWVKALGQRATVPSSRVLPAMPKRLAVPAWGGLPESGLAPALAPGRASQFRRPPAARRNHAPARLRRHRPRGRISVPAGQLVGWM